MFDHPMSCAACGEKLNVTAASCPRCGALRTVAVADEVSARKREGEPEKAASTPPAAPSTPPTPAFFIAPADEPRRAWRPSLNLCPSQLKKIGIGAAVVFGLAWIGYGYWWSVKSEEARKLAALKQAMAQQQRDEKATELPPIPVPLPTAPPVDDQTLVANVRMVLTGYNPLGAAMKYKYEVKDGVVTIAGEAENQAEKDGVENVIKGMNGVKAVINQMTVKTATPSDLVKVMPGTKLTEAEAKRLEEILGRGQAGDQRRAEEDRLKQEQAEAQRRAEQEADRQRREQAAAKVREEEAALRKQAEERLKQEAADYERRQEEQRRAEQERRARAEQARLVANTLRTGTVAWSGIVDGTDDVVISGASASVRHVAGDPVKEARASFSAAVPRAPVSVKLLSSNGRAPIKIVQEPSAANGYTTIVRIGEGEKGGGKRHEFTLKWSAQ